MNKRFHVPVDGTTHISVYRSGNPEGPAVLLLHSLATSSVMWKEQAQALANAYDVIRVDFRGHGGSLPTAGPFTFEQLGSDVISTLDYLKIPRAAVVGLSLGGIIAVHAAFQSPDRFTKAVIADCRLDATPGYRELWSERRRLVESEGLPAISDSLLASWITPRTRAQNPAVVPLLAGMVHGTDKTAWMGMVDELCTMSCKACLPELHLPALIMAGDCDPAREEMSTWPRSLGLARYTEIAGASHLSNLDQPQLFSKALLDFLATR